jgi:hypothetical protein
MKKNNKIPAGKISIREAFETVYRTITPDWQSLEERLNPASKHYDNLSEQDAECARREAWRNYDRAQRCANKLLRQWMSQGILIAWSRDPETGQDLQLDPDEWASMGAFETGITDNFVAPGDPLQSGPNTVEKDEQQAVFFDRKEFENVLSEIAQPAKSVDAPRVTETLKNKGGRPPDYEWDKDIKPFFIQTIEDFGKPGPNNKRLPSTTQLIEVILGYCAEKDLHPAHSTVRDHVYQWLAEIDGS